MCYLNLQKSQQQRGEGWGEEGIKNTRVSGHTLDTGECMVMAGPAGSWPGPP